MQKILIAFLVFLLVSCSGRETVSNITVIGILPYKDFPKEKIDSVKADIEKYYGVSVCVLNEKPLPESAFVNIKSPRYRADSIITIQLRQKPDSIDYIVGLTHKDISAPRYENGKIKEPVWKYNDFGIMGLAYRPGKSCVVSTFRLKTPDKQLHFTRLKKVVLHELGHNFGLAHCKDKKCVMTSAAEKIKTIDNANPQLCSKCRAKVLK
ncbi:matrixin family metalloprotease [Flavobacterium sp. RHBU_3]|uniref:matrixin family metalloprotease n=1 Tax=Flavobacterium sp. RHBU_3 TaxID=3391184 RepID=UPI003984BD9D